MPEAPLNFTNTILHSILNDGSSPHLWGLLDLASWRTLIIDQTINIGNNVIKFVIVFLLIMHH